MTSQLYRICIYIAYAESKRESFSVIRYMMLFAVRLEKHFGVRVGKPSSNLSSDCQFCWQNVRRRKVPLVTNTRCHCASDEIDFAYRQDLRLTSPLLTQPRFYVFTGAASAALVERQADSQRISNDRSETFPGILGTPVRPHGLRLDAPAVQDLDVRG